MPRVSRSRVLAVERERVWGLVADPDNLIRWWPRAKRVEDVREGDDGRARWTTALETERGVTVRADYRCVARVEGTSLAWEQEVEGSPFERILRASRVELALADDRAGATRLSLTAVESLRGLARLGGPLMRGASRRRLDGALDGVERALVGDG